jgi:hypothetical protein
MSTRCVALIATTLVLAAGAGPAWAQGGAGQAQKIGQNAVTKQGAEADADAKQNAVNGNAPVTIAGGSVFGGSSSANQAASNAAKAVAVNAAATKQTANATQVGGASSCKAGCGGAGQFQAVGQNAVTKQNADADADAKQNAVNGNAPVAIAGKHVSGGSSSANQAASNKAGAAAANLGLTSQTANATQVGGSSACGYGCGGAGQFQAVGQNAVTKQNADADADAKQNAVNGNAPVTIAGGSVFGGSSSANQTASNSAGAAAGNLALTSQTANATQVGGSSSCAAGCGGAGQFQLVGQNAVTKQNAEADADADQNAVNANVPVTIAGGSVYGGSSSANQAASNKAGAAAGNLALTSQAAAATQMGGTTSCKAGCGGAGQFQLLGQNAFTVQNADADADADQNAVNANVPVTIAGGNVFGGSSSANQTASNAAGALSLNLAKTLQQAFATQVG